MILPHGIRLQPCQDCPSNDTPTQGIPEQSNADNLVPILFDTLPGLPSNLLRERFEILGIWVKVLLTVIFGIMFPG